MVRGEGVDQPLEDTGPEVFDDVARTDRRGALGVGADLGKAVLVQGQVVGAGLEADRLPVAAGPLDCPSAVADADVDEVDPSVRVRLASQEDAALDRLELGDRRPGLGVGAPINPPGRT